MTSRGSLLASIANTIQDYRAMDIAKATPDHVDQWVQQFAEDVQVPLLIELDHVLTHLYLSEDVFAGFFGALVKNKKLAGDEPCAFWAKANFLNIQKQGHSQQEILKMFAKILREQCGFEIEDCGTDGGAYIYLDDVMFSGNRVGNDLSTWITEKAPAKAIVHVVVMANHTSGQYFVEGRMRDAIANSGKSIEIHYWHSLIIENRKYYKNNSEVLWPAMVPEDAATKAYLALPHKFPQQLRDPGGKLGPFSSEEGRQLLERELLVAGVKIRGLSQNPKDILRPLGFSPFGAGFGSMIVTFRNCPNNCPLALWWGDPEATSGPFHWYPLFPRKTYAKAVDFYAIL